MENRIIITVGRQFGSGGREIGKKLAETLGIAYYDKELLTLVAQESGLCPEFVEKSDEKTSGGLFRAFAIGLSMSGPVYQPNESFSGERIFQIQSDIIRRVAQEGSCVIVGRCADYILREEPNVVNVFISASSEDRLRRVMERKSISEDEAKTLIGRTDKTRASYYNYYTDKQWGYMESYHLGVDSSAVGVDNAVEMIRLFAEKRIQLSMSQQEKI